jgi:hypothetical protein
MDAITQHQIPNRLRKATAIGDTRWLSITNALNAFLDNYATFQRHYERLLTKLQCARLQKPSSVPKAKLEAVKGIVTKLKNKSLAAEAHDLAWVYHELAKCSKSFQDRSLTLADMYPCVSKIFGRLASIVLGGTPLTSANE